MIALLEKHYSQIPLQRNWQDVQKISLKRKFIVGKYAPTYHKRVRKVPPYIIRIIDSTKRSLKKKERCQLRRAYLYNKRTNNYQTVFYPHIKSTLPGEETQSQYIAVQQGTSTELIICR